MTRHSNTWIMTTCLLLMTGCQYDQNTAPHYSPGRPSGLTFPPERTHVVDTSQICPPPDVKTHTDTVEMSATINGLPVIGCVEAIFLHAANQTLDAQIDTGSTTSFLAADHIVEFDRDGSRWVRFQISRHVGANQSQALTLPVSNRSRSQRHNGSRNTTNPSVRLKVTLGDIDLFTDFTLMDSNQLSFPVLLGRNFLKGNAMVDSSKTHIARNHALILTELAMPHSVNQ
ncbi:RimK/LysX family protein [Kistimonas asteriae]|uniref:putative ATP-dependent zinc protease n=1 Tax=Kistimonas asteriae TaxID=517724 RepID=UPI001BAB7678|nr:RimK/LysX family protein [Kistimonas asteriae]